ncbi:MAG: hypothetical protein QG635_940, partial [Bacteroidota bacterium]|nr:hypothetical protein [Bacteroidota bacterium]
IGKTLCIIKDYKNSIVKLNQAIEISKTIQDKMTESLALKSLGKVFLDNCEYSSALDFYIPALEISKTNRFGNLTAELFNTIGLIYSYQHDLNSAVKYYYFALSNVDTSRNRNLFQDISNNIGETFREQGKLDDAIFHFTQSLEIALYYKELGNICSSYINLGRVYLLKKDFSKAQNFYDLAYDMCQRNNYDNIELAELNYYFGELNISRKDFKKAELHLKLSLNLFKKEDYPESVKKTYHLLSDLYRNMNDYKQSYYYLEQYSSLNDSLSFIYGEASRNFLKDKFNAHQELINYKISKENSENQSNQRIIIIIFIISFLVIAAALVKLYRTYSEKKRELNKTNNNFHSLYFKLSSDIRNMLFPIAEKVVKINSNTILDNELKESFDKFTYKYNELLKQYDDNDEINQ